MLSKIYLQAITTYALHEPAGSILMKEKALIPSIDDPEFAEAIRARNPKAFERVVHAYLHQVLRTARGAGLDTQKAQDTTQATFLAFMEAAPRFEGRSRVRTWLFGILYNKISEARREVGRDQRKETINETMEQRFLSDGSWARPPAPMDLHVHNQEVLQGIQECLDGVPTQQRMAFLLREVEGRPTQEICKILGVTITNLGVILYRCRNALRECLEEKGINQYSC